MNPRNRLVLLTLIFVLSCLHAQVPPKKHPRPDESEAALRRGALASKLIGTWKLVSYTEKAEIGTSLHPYGDEPIGLAIFDATGHMSVQIMKIPHATFADGYEHATAQQVKSVYEAYLAYYGTWAVDEANEKLVQSVKASNRLDYASQVLSHDYFFEKEQLTLRTINDFAGKQYSTAIVWERLR